jgi:hypothetical protein
MTFKGLVQKLQESNNWEVHLRNFTAWDLSDDLKSSWANGFTIGPLSRNFPNSQLYDNMSTLYFHIIQLFNVNSSQQFYQLAYIVASITDMNCV